MTYTEDSIIGDVLDERPDLAVYFTQIGMHCLGCPCSRGETIAEACEVHDTDVEKFLEKINSVK